MKTTGLILAGGRGSRVGGADKGLLNWEGGTLVDAVLARFAPQVDQVLISCNRNLEQYAQRAATVSDELADFQGPLAGLCAALPQCKTELIITVPCDCPNLPLNLVSRLIQQLHSGNYELCYAHDGEREQYLFSALHKGCEQRLRDYLAGGGRSVRGWHETLRVVQEDFSDVGAHFRNLNTLGT